METLEAKIIAEEGELPATAPCGICSILTAPFALVCPDEEAGLFICGHCITNQHRAAVLEAEAAALAALEVSTPWETEHGKWVRAERNRRRDAVAWAINPLTSPLSSVCQAEFVQYVKELHTLTIDYATPAAVVWPVEPALAYPEPEE